MLSKIPKIAKGDLDKEILRAGIIAERRHPFYEGK
jgi:hypothetical protein